MVRAWSAHGPSDRLTNPPRGVGRELETLGVVELLDGADQTEVALLDQVKEEHAAAGITLRQGDNQPEVGLEQVVLGVLAVLGDPPQLTLELHVYLVAGVELLLSEQTGLDALCELDLLLGVEKCDLANLLEVVLDRVSRSSCGDDLLGGRVILVIITDDESSSFALILGGFDLGLVDLVLRVAVTGRGDVAIGLAGGAIL